MTHRSLLRIIRSRLQRSAAPLCDDTNLLPASQGDLLDAPWPEAKRAFERLYFVCLRVRCNARIGVAARAARVDRKTVSTKWSALDDDPA